MREHQEGARRGKKRLAVASLCAGAALAVSVVLLCAGKGASGASAVQVVQDGNVLYTFSLDTAPDERIRIEAENGSYNVVEVRDGTIFVAEAGCPDQICVKSGILNSPQQPIVCLPNRLVIRFAPSS